MFQIWCSRSLGLFLSFVSNVSLTGSARNLSVAPQFYYDHSKTGNMKVTIDEEDVGEEAFNEILRLARTGETSELYKDSKKTWVLYGVSICHPSHIGYARSEDQQGVTIENLHGLLANTDGAPFNDKMNRRERDESESILEDYADDEVMKVSGDRWYLNSSEPINGW